MQMMSKAKDSLGCCVGSQQDFAVANRISDEADTLANHTYWNRHHCNVRVPDRCSVSPNAVALNVQTDLKATITEHEASCKR